MSKNTEEKQPFFTLRRKGFASLICLGAAVLWAVLWLVFPMQFYSLFFASNIGSNLVLILLAVMVTFPFNFIFSKVLSADIPVVPSLIVNIICMVAFIYLYSVSGFISWWWTVLAVAVHIIASVVIFVKSKPVVIPKVKTEKKPLRSAVFGVIGALLSDSLYFLLFTALLNIFRE